MARTQAWRIDGGPEQGFWRCFVDGFNLSLVSSVTQAITVTEKQNTAIKISVKSLVRPFNIVRFEDRWDIQSPHLLSTSGTDWQGNKCFALFR